MIATTSIKCIATFGIILFLNQAVRVIWGAAPLTLPVPDAFTGSVRR